MLIATGLAENKQAPVRPARQKQAAAEPQLRMTTLPLCAHLSRAGVVAALQHLLDGHLHAAPPGQPHAAEAAAPQLLDLRLEERISQQVRGHYESS